MILRSVALFFIFALSACGSPPIQYYTLMPTASEQRQVMNAPSIQFEMLDVRVPMQVDQPQIVVRKSADGLMLLESARWSAPLADELHDAVAGQLELKLGGVILQALPKRPTYHLFWYSSISDDLIHCWEVTR